MKMDREQEGRKFATYPTATTTTKKNRKGKAGLLMIGWGTDQKREYNMRDSCEENDHIVHTRRWRERERERELTWLEVAIATQSTV